MRQSIFRSLLLAVFGAVFFGFHGLANGQFRGRETPPSEKDRIPETLEKLVNEIDEEALAKPPERDYKVEKEPVQQIVKLFRADPKLLENEFSARMVLTVTTSFGTHQPNTVPEAARDLRYNELSRAVHDLPQGVKRLIDGRHRISIFTGIDLSTRSLFWGQPVSTIDAARTLSAYFNFLSELCPKDQLPPQADMEFLTSVDCDRDVQWSYGSRPLQANERREWHITVYAPTEELAEQRVRAIVQLLDNGLCRPLQRDCLAEAKKSLEAAQQGYEEVARQSETIRAKEETLAEPSEITPDILSQLKAQKVMLAIESAGLDARIKACNAMFKEGPAVPPSTRESISDMKVRAEVELIGSKEKLDRINGFIAEGNNRNKLREEIDRLRGTRQELQVQIDRTHERRAEAYARFVSLYAPLEIKDNKITVSPVEWTN